MTFIRFHRRFYDINLITFWLLFTAVCFFYQEFMCEYPTQVTEKHNPEYRESVCRLAAGNLETFENPNFTKYPAHEDSSVGQNKILNVS